MKFVIFGAGGFVGNALNKFLLDSGHISLPVFRREGAKGGRNIDVTKSEDFALLQDFSPDVIVNCASALPDPEGLNNPDKLLNFYNVNVVGAANITNWALSAGVGRIINCSTLAVVGKPWPSPLFETANTYPLGMHVPYFTSKLAQELVMTQIAGQGNLSIVHLRLSAIYGPGMKWEGILPKLIKDFKGDKPVSLRNANNVYFDFLHVHDLCKLILMTAEAGNIENGIYNAASGEEISLYNLAVLIKENIGQAPALTNNDDNNIISRANIENSKLLHAINEPLFKFTRIDKGVLQMISEFNNYINK